MRARWSLCELVHTVRVYRGMQNSRIRKQNRILGKESPAPAFLTIAKFLTYWRLREERKRPASQTYSNTVVDNIYRSPQQTIFPS